MILKLRRLPIYKADNSSDLSNYRPISVLPCFPKMLERIMWKNEYTLGVFIDLSKAFDSVDHSILLRKLVLHGIADRNYAWIKSYLSNNLQYIQVH